MPVQLFRPRSAQPRGIRQELLQLHLRKVLPWRCLRQLRVASQARRSPDIIYLLGTVEEIARMSHGKPKVLVVDDEHVIADTLAIILNQNGFEALPIYTGEDAIDRARKLRPDLLISDVIFKNEAITGIDVAIKVRQSVPGCKILLFSGQAATADLLETARAQGHEFEILAKPVHPQDLLAKLGQ